MAPEDIRSELAAFGLLGFVKIGDVEIPNPIGMSITVDDAEIILELCEDKEFIAIYGAQPFPIEWAIPLGRLHDDDPETLKLIELVTAAGRRVALRRARTILQKAGVDIADRPISIEPHIVLPDATKFHVVTPIVVLPTEEHRCPQD